MSDFEKNNNFNFDDDDFFNDEDISYQSYSNTEKPKKKSPLSTIILAFLFIVVIVLVIIVVKNSLGDDNDNTTTTAPITTTLPQNYTTVLLTEDDISKGQLVLINNSHSYKYDTTQGGLEKLYSASTAYALSGSELQVTKETLKNLKNWLEDFKETANKSSDKRVIIIDAFRSDADQAKLFNYYVDLYGSEEEAKKYAQPSGYSEHHSGLCIDMKVWDGIATSQLKDNAEFRWVLDNAHKYGFIQRYPEGKTTITGVATEPGHFRYIGVAHATAMMKNNASCLESYIDFLRNYTFEGEHLMVECDNGDKYEIYFSNSLTVNVPTDKEYTISGNNVDGFIVTIKN